MEDLTIIRIKRSRESAPLENISLTSKKFKLDSGKSLPVIATLKSKNECLETVLQTAVTKFKQEKQSSKQKLHSPGHQDLYKQKTPLRKKGTSAQNAKAALDRYQIVNKARGITPLDAEAESYLLKTDRLSLNLPDELKKPDEASSSKAGDVATTEETASTEGDGARVIPLQFIDVDHCSVKELNKQQEDVICMNGVPLEQSFVYDIFITRVPKGYSTEEFQIRDVYDSHLVDDASSGDDNFGDSDDSNAEDNYRNDYPEGEESDMNQSDADGSEYFLSDNDGVTGTSQYWGDNIADQMAHCHLDDGDDADNSESDDEEGDVLAGERIPPEYKSLFRLSKAVLSTIKHKDPDTDSEETSDEELDSDDCSEEEGDY